MGAGEIRQILSSRRIVGGLTMYTLTQEEMFEFGYKWERMQPLTLTEAMDLFNSGKCTVYALFADDTEAEMDSKKMMLEYALMGCMFGKEMC